MIMKKIKILFAVLIVTSFAISCSSDDGGDPTGGDLTARWNETKTILKVSGDEIRQDYVNGALTCGKDYIEFTDAGIATRVVYGKDGDNNCIENPGTPAEWSRNENTLVISNGYYGGTYTIKKLTNSQLTIESTSTSGSITTVTTVYFTKASM